MTLAAIRQVSENKTHRVLEGLGIPFGGPFNGSDSYGTRATRDSNLHLDAWPDGGLLLYHHGLDPEIGFSRIGSWKPIRTDDKGVWIQAQLMKAHAWADAIGELVDLGALGFSAGTRQDNMSYTRTGDWRDWPVMEISLEPMRSNPWAVITTRSAEPADLIEIVDAAPMPEAPSVEIVAAIRERAVAAVRGIQTYDDLAAAAEMNEELPEAFDTLTSAIYSAIYATDADFNPVPADEKRTAIQTSLDQFRDAVLGILDAVPAGRSGEMLRAALRVGKRNRASDQEHIDAAHDHIAALGPAAHPTDTTATETDAARTAEARPALEIVDLPAVRTDVDPLREIAERAGKDAALRFIEDRTR
jgi:hypothetical protein